MDLAVAVRDDEVERWRLASRGGLRVGYSAAANVGACAALLDSGRLAAEAVVVTVLCDTGLKYWPGGRRSVRPRGSATLPR